MYWLSPGIVFALAYATCMLLFGLVGLLLRNRRAAETSVKYAVNAEPGPARPAQNGQSAEASGRSVSLSRSTGLLASVGPQYDPRRATKPVASVGNGQNAVPSNLSLFPDKTELAVPANGISREESELENIVNQLLRAPTKSAGKNGASGSSDDVEVVDSRVISEEPEEESVALAPVATAGPCAASLEPPPTQNFLEFFGLKQQPFDVTPDPAYLYLSPSHSEALTSIRQAIEYLRGFLMLVAEPGMGKTTLMNKLMEELSESARVVFLFQTQCTSKELLCFILDELEVEHDGMDVVAMHRALNQVLLEEMLRGRRFVLIIDEAQNLEEPVLETVRLLSNFETTHSKLIQIVLVGQPQLTEVLLRPSLKQLRQRVAVRSTLKALGVPETKQYIEHRLRTAGLQGMGIFTPGAMAQVAKLSEGVPRTINNLCFNAMLAAFRQGKKVICTELVQKTAKDLNLEPSGHLS